MKRSISRHNGVALAAGVAWLATVVVTVMNPDTRARALAPVLLCSVVATLGAVLLGRYWTRRGSVPALGSLLVVPITCAGLFVVGPLFWEACREGDWFLLTPSYYQQAKGGWAELYFPLLVIGGVSAFPAAAVVAFFQGRQDVRGRGRTSHAD